MASKRVIAGGALLALAALLFWRRKDVIEMAQRATGSNAAKARAVMPQARAAAQSAGVPVEWVLAIMAKESGFNWYAVAAHPWDLEAGAGAYGATQILYTTAKGLGYNGPAPRPPPASLVTALQRLGGSPGRRDRGAWTVWNVNIPRTPDAKTREASNLIRAALDRRVGGTASGGWLPYNPDEGLLSPATQLNLTARLIRDLRRRFNNTNDFRDIAAGWNSGLSYSAARQAADAGDTKRAKTVNEYVPAAVAYVEAARSWAAA